ncbi:MAG TPA: hypothetical protein PLM60_07555 [Methanoregulaceae archaeon]|jgi:hypothetical protein|nr:hypothetical protein [Burkholderiaceae bacterium]NLH25124.1 hypothetical protein [Methanomicrobiales archaeon]HNW80927.1 hypothetical protein [Methanoregulaceae archaeon]HPS23244.1 hypothetical protein [Methanoregulaceae archaeon]
MDPFQEFSLKRAEYERAKHKLLIGIFGSFRRDEIFLLHQALLDDDFRVCISTDLESEVPKGLGMSKDAYNYLLSITLLTRCEIRIFLFHREHEGEHNVNQSASMELQYLAQEGLNESVFILLEEGYVQQSGGVFKGLKANFDTACRWESYRDFPALIDMVRKFLFNRILFLSGDPNRRRM